MESPRRLITFWNVFTKIWHVEEDIETRTYHYQTDENDEPVIVNEVYVFADDVRAFSRMGVDVTISQYTAPGTGWINYTFANEALAMEAVEEIIKKVTS